MTNKPSFLAAIAAAPTDNTCRWSADGWTTRATRKSGSSHLRAPWMERRSEPHPAISNRSRGGCRRPAAGAIGEMCLVCGVIERGSPRVRQQALHRRIGRQAKAAVPKPARFQPDYHVREGREALEDIGRREHRNRQVEGGSRTNWAVRRGGEQDWPMKRGACWRGGRTL